MNSMQMPQQPQPMQGAGLGAMLQAKGSAAAGVSKQSMNEMMARARELPDSELADVLAGKSMAVPQFAAMLAAMGRQSLRTAVAGAQAGAAKAPSKKEQVLASMQPEQAAGLPALPAQNMEQLGEGMADGGIVAFSGADGSVVRPDDDGFTQEELNRLRTDNPNAFQRLMRRMFPGVVDNAAGYTRESTVFTPPPKDVPFTTGPQTEGGALLPFRRPRGASNAPTPPSRSEQLLPPQDLSLLERPAPDTTMTDMDITRDTGVAGGELPKVPGVNAPKAATPSDGTASGGANRPATGGPKLTGIGVPQAGSSEAPAGRKSPIDELTAPLDEIRKQVASGKEQAQGEFLMTLGARIMRTPNLGAAIGQGIQEGLPGLAANRKEANMLLKDQRDYNLNLAKAKEAAAQGRDDLAFKYADLAEKAQYHAGMVGAYMARAGSANTFGPKQYQAAMSNAQKEVDAYINKLGPLEKRKMTPEIRQQLLETAFSRNIQAYQSGSMPSMPDPRVVLEPPKGGNVLSRD